MLCVRAEHWVPRQVNIVHVIAVEGSRIRDGNTQILKILLSQMTSHTVIVAPLYSAFVLEHATIGYFLLLQEMAPLPRQKMNPEVVCRPAL